MSGATPVYRRLGFLFFSSARRRFIGGASAVGTFVCDTFGGSLPRVPASAQPCRAGDSRVHRRRGKSPYSSVGNKVGQPECSRFTPRFQRFLRTQARIESRVHKFKACWRTDKPAGSSPTQRNRLGAIQA